jgi:hypothetical protein
MPKIPANLIPKSVNIQSTANVIPGLRQDNTARINAATAQGLGNLGNQLSAYMDDKEKERDNADLENGRRKFMELDSERKEKMLSASTAKDVQTIHSEYEKRAQEILTGNDHKGVPYFRSEKARKIFDDKFLANNLKGWKDGAIKQSWDKEDRETKIRNNLSVNDIIKNHYNDKGSEGRIREIYSKYPEAERKSLTQRALYDLDKNRVNQNAAVFSNSVENIYLNQDVSNKDKQKLINDELKAYSSHIDGMKSLSVAEKKAYKDRLKNTVSQVNDMVEAQKNEQVKAYKKWQDQNESDVITQIAKKGTNLQDMPYKEVLSLINQNPDAFSQSFKEEILKGVFAANKKEAERIQKQKEEKTEDNKKAFFNSQENYWKEQDKNKKAFFNSQENYWKEQDKNSDLKAFDKVLNFSGNHEDWKKLTVEIIQMNDSSKRTKAYSMLMDANPSRTKTEKESFLSENKSLYAKQLDTVLGFNLSAKQKEKLNDWDDPNSYWDKDRITHDDMGNEIFDGLSENERLELKTKLLMDFQRLYKESPDKAETYIKEQIKELNQSVDDRKYYKEYMRTKLNIGKKTPKVPEGWVLTRSKKTGAVILYNPQTKERREE